MSDVPIEEAAPLVVREVAVLKKFDGDLTDEEMDNTDPLEEVHLFDGEVIKHVVGGEVQYDAEAGIGTKPNFEEM